MSTSELRDLILRGLEFAPAAPCGPIAAGLLGWRVDVLPLFGEQPETLFLCSTCASRLIARGCGIPKGMSPVWVDDLRAHDACVGCTPAPAVLEYTLPAPWASYLVNGDNSGLAAGEEANIDLWLESEGLYRADCVSVSEDAWFAWTNDATAIGGTVCTFAFLSATAGRR